MAARPGGHRHFRHPGASVDVLVVALVLLAVAVAAVVLRARARRRTERLKMSGGRKSLVMNLFGRS